MESDHLKLVADLYQRHEMHDAIQESGEGRYVGFASVPNGGLDASGEGGHGRSSPQRAVPSAHVRLSGVPERVRAVHRAAWSFATRSHRLRPAAVRGKTVQHSLAGHGSGEQGDTAVRQDVLAEQEVLPVHRYSVAVGCSLRSGSKWTCQNVVLERGW